MPENPQRSAGGAHQHPPFERGVGLWPTLGSSGAQIFVSHGQNLQGEIWGLCRVLLKGLLGQAVGVVTMAQMMANHKSPHGSRRLETSGSGV